ncbi:MAG: hypothetical protein WC026_13205 [Hyphomicrobium sp.]|uniref:hypothetical protein n=1 Tax=Hyphomicrobium sp. TaxID=82 RepID=UPI00356288D9
METKHEFHLVPTEKVTNLAMLKKKIGDYLSGALSLTKHVEVYPSDYFLNQILVITDDSEIKENDLVHDSQFDEIYIANDVVIHNKKSLQYQYLKKIVASNSKELFPNHYLVGEKDVDYIVHYYNYFNVLPTVKLQMEKHYIQQQFSETDIEIMSPKTVNNEVVIVFDAEFLLALSENKRKNDKILVHLEHCFQGEYKNSCKYGEDKTCPSNPKKQEINPEKKKSDTIVHEMLDSLIDDFAFVFQKHFSHDIKFIMDRLHQKTSKMLSPENKEVEQEYCSGAYFCHKNTAKYICDQCGLPLKLKNGRKNDFESKLNEIAFENSKKVNCENLSQEVVAWGQNQYFNGFKEGVIWGKENVK